MLSFLKPAPAAPPLDPAKVPSRYRWLRWQVFSGIFIGYAAFYLVRGNFSLALPSVLKAHPEYSKAQLGTAMTALALAYGLSKFIMGSVSDRSNPRWFMPLGLFLTSVVTFSFGVFPAVYSSLALIIGLQFVNGWFNGMGWPPCGKTMVHWWSTKERGVTVGFWNVAHNVGGAAIAYIAVRAVGQQEPMRLPPVLDQIARALDYLVVQAVHATDFVVIHTVGRFSDWGGIFYVNAAFALAVAVFIALTVRDTPQSCGLPSIEEYKNDYPPEYSAEHERVLTFKEIFLGYVLNNKYLWFIAIANAFIYFVRYGVLNWIPTYLQTAKGFNFKEAGFAWTAFELAGIPGTILCGLISDRVFKGRRAPPTILFMVLTLVGVIVYWLNGKGPLWLDITALISIGFFIYGPIMLVGLHALDLVPKKAAGTAAGFTGFFGYAFGSAIAGTGVGWVWDHWGTNAVFVTMIVCCVLTMVFSALTLGHRATSTSK